MGRPTAVYDAIVVGAGAIGMATALALHARGLSCLVLERGRVGAESSWAGGGILAPLRPWHYPEAVWALVARSRMLYSDWRDHLQARSGLDIELLDCGACLIDEADLDRARDWHAQQGLPCQDTRCGDRTALSMPWVQQVRNPRLIRALRGTLEASGVAVYENTVVTGLAREGDRVTGVTTTNGHLHAANTVIAAGAWSGDFDDRIASRVRPMRGQMLRLEIAPSRIPGAGVWLLPDAYVIVRADGTTLLGSTVEDVGFDKSITEEARDRLLAVAADYLPWTAQARVVDHWAGLRPGSADGKPIIGADEMLPGLWWNTGHFRTGLAMAPASAERLAEAMVAAA